MNQHYSPSKSFWRSTSIVFALVAIFAAVVVLDSPDASAKASKTVVCHVEGNGSVHEIEIADPAARKHIAHGDALPGDPVPGMAGYQYDETCTPILTDADGDGCTIDGTFVDTVASQPECDALIAIYSSTNGTGWNNDTGWTTPTDPCTWHGVGCTTNLINLLLHSNQLSGSIPPELGDLTNLINLNLNFNQLSGVIPSELGTLSNLASLSLGSNQLSGAIPPALGDLTSLTHLNLSSNQLSGSIPPELGEATSLVNLNLGGNQLSGSIPAGLGTLSDLTVLTLSNNQLSGSIPPELGDLSSLVQLFLQINQLSGSIPPELGDLANLTHLNLHFNLLSGDLTAALSGLIDTLATSASAIRLADGGGGNDCFTSTDTAVTQFLNTYNVGWDLCENP